ncbi:hypothetical protein BJ973_004479 [Actinoplanes tereljensis]
MNDRTTAAPTEQLDRCPTCHGLGEGCTKTVCHGLDSD